MELDEYSYDTESDFSESCDQSDWSESSCDSCDETDWSQSSCDSCDETKVSGSDWTPSDSDWSLSRLMNQVILSLIRRIQM